MALLRPASRENAALEQPPQSFAPSKATLAAAVLTIVIAATMKTIGIVSTSKQMQRAS